MNSRPFTFCRRSTFPKSLPRAKRPQFSRPDRSSTQLPVKQSSSITATTTTTTLTTLTTTLTTTALRARSILLRTTRPTTTTTNHRGITLPLPSTTTPTTTPSTRAVMVGVTLHATRLARVVRRQAAGETLAALVMTRATATITPPSTPTRTPTFLAATPAGTLTIISPTTAMITRGPTTL